VKKANIIEAGWNISSFQAIYQVTLCPDDDDGGSGRMTADRTEPEVEASVLEALPHAPQ